MSAPPARPGSTLLVNEPPLQVLPTLAQAVGLSEAIVLQQLHYWLQRARHERDGRPWVRFTYEEWQAQLPWWSLRTLKTLLPDLEARGLIATANYNRHPTDRTKWYTINYYHPALAAPAGEGAGPLLIAEPPLQALPTLARTIGLNEALVLQQVHYRLRHARHERDGRRWVYNTYEQWQEEFPFWSVRTLKRIFHALEERGLLLTATYNRSPLDRTKWYAVRYEHPLLAGAAPSSATGRPECNPGTIAACSTDTMASCEAGPLAGQDRHDRGATLARSNHETPAETPARSATENREGEQQRAAPAAGDAPTPVVVAPIDLLVRRGVTPVAAARLAGSVAAATIERQVAIYDWLREQAPDDARLTPGRLRRMIEEDWAPPPGFVPPAERARQAALAAAAAEEGRRARAAAARRHEAAVADEAALLASLGLAAEDQAVWRALAEQPPRLPAVFGRALFYAPRGATPPALLFRERADAALAASPAYAPHRVEVERRLCDRFPRYARARVTAGRPAYLACDDVLAALRASTAPGDDA